jgi:predicted DNA-binding transcriptional regulator YafY
MSTSVNKKINHIYLLLERLAKGEELYPQNEALSEELGVDKRTLDRYLKDIHQLYSHIVTTEKKNKEFAERKVTVYRIVDKKKDVSEIFRFFMENKNDLSWLLQLVHENDPTLLDDMEDKQMLEQSIKKDKDIFLFKSTPFENIQNEKQKELFSKLKSAVKYHQYKTIQYKYHKTELLRDVKCLKLVYMSNNWYLAIEDIGDRFRFLRLSFIEVIKNSTKSTYQSRVLDRYIDFFTTLQNPMTLDAQKQKAHIRASQKIALYFQKDMKPFFTSQKFIRTNEDGTVEFSIDYTQPIEILPFIKQWQPDLIILSPDSLADELVEDMKQSIENYIK